MPWSHNWNVVKYEASRQFTFSPQTEVDFLTQGSDLGGFARCKFWVCLFFLIWCFLQALIWFAQRLICFGVRAIFPEEQHQCTGCSFGFAALDTQCIFAVACFCSREDMVACTFSRISLSLSFSCALCYSGLLFLPFPFPSPILLLTPPPAMEMNSVLWIWGWRWGLQQISSPACKTASWLAANILQVLSSQPEFLSAITWPWIPRQRNVHAFFF